MKFYVDLLGLVKENEEWTGVPFFRFTYKKDNWVVRLQIANLLDEDYVQAATSRANLVIGDPINVKGSFTWNF